MSKCERDRFITRDKEEDRDSISILLFVFCTCHFNDSLFFVRATLHLLHLPVFLCISGIPAVIVANKCDMENGRVVRTDEGQALASELRSVFS